MGAGRPGSGWQGWGVGGQRLDPWSLLALLIRLQGSLLWVVTYMDPQDPILFSNSVKYSP